MSAIVLWQKSISVSQRLCRTRKHN